MHCLLIALLLAWGAVVQCHGAVGTRSSLFHRPIDISTFDHVLPKDYIVDTSNRPIDTSSSDHALAENFRLEVDTTRTRRSVDTSRTGGVDWNNVVDTIFSAAKHEISDLGKEILPLSEVRRNFTRNFGFVKVNGRFLANQGTLRNLTSFRRSGDVYAVKEGSHYKMVCTLTLDDLRVKYEHYELDVFRFGPRGHIEGTVTSNTIRMTLTFAKVDEGCLSSLQEVKLAELGGLKVNVSGLGNFDSLGSAIATWIVEQRRAEIVENIERVLSREVEEALRDFQCDEYASLLFL